MHCLSFLLLRIRLCHSTASNNGSIDTSGENERTVEPTERLDLCRGRGWKASIRELFISREEGVVWVSFRHITPRSQGDRRRALSARQRPQETDAEKRLDWIWPWRVESGINGHLELDYYPDGSPGNGTATGQRRGG
ncbi:hypothetical protein V8C44DRAFT_339635 [Trichoderma aethiopicum]